MADNGIGSSVPGASGAADLAIAIEESGAPETAWDRLCGLSLGLIPVNKNYFRMKISFTDSRKGNSRTYVIREHLSAHLSWRPSPWRKPRTFSPAPRAWIDRNTGKRWKVSWRPGRGGKSLS